MYKVRVIGAGLAGSEATWQLAAAGVNVDLYEMKPLAFSPAHKNKDFAELVCSNSLRSDDYEHNAVGLLHEEMRRSGSLILEAADQTKVPAGGALAVDRDRFADLVTQKIGSLPNVRVFHQEIDNLSFDDDLLTIIATGPLTSPKLMKALAELVQDRSLSFFDAIAPVVYTESIDFSKAWYQSRYDKGESRDYINCPLDKAQYYAFVEALNTAEKVEYHDFEKEQYFDGCLPIEVMAERGADTLLFGPMKPVGLTNPHKTEKPYAVVQLRQDNQEDTLRNIVGFQTKLKHGEQIRIFKMIPGLENAQFARLGGIHKNTFIQSPVLLNSFLQLTQNPKIMFAGQITGCEGYVESAAVGYLAGYFASCLVKGQTPLLPPRETAFGSMLSHLVDQTDVENFQPMNINFGLFPNLELVRGANGKIRKLKGLERKEAYSRRALDQLQIWLEQK